MPTLLIRNQLEKANRKKTFFFLRKEINFPPQMIKIEPGMEAGTAICLYVIFFFQAAQSIMHYLYFRF